MKGLRYPPYPIPPLPSPKVLQEALDKFLEYEAMLQSPPLPPSQKNEFRYDHDLLRNTNKPPGEEPSAPPLSPPINFLPNK